MLAPHHLRVQLLAVSANGTQYVFFPDCNETHMYNHRGDHIGLLGSYDLRHIHLVYVRSEPQTERVAQSSPPDTPEPSKSIEQPVGVEQVHTPQQVHSDIAAQDGVGAAPDDVSTTPSNATERAAVPASSAAAAPAPAAAHDTKWQKRSGRKIVLAEPVEVCVAAKPRAKTQSKSPVKNKKQASALLAAAQTTAAQPAAPPAAPAAAAPARAKKVRPPKPARKSKPTFDQLVSEYTQPATPKIRHRGFVAKPTLYQIYGRRGLDLFNFISFTYKVVKPDEATSLHARPMYSMKRHQTTYYTKHKWDTLAIEATPPQPEHLPPIRALDDTDAQLRRTSDTIGQALAWFDQIAGIIGTAYIHSYTSEIISSVSSSICSIEAVIAKTVARDLYLHEACNLHEVSAVASFYVPEAGLANMLQRAVCAFLKCKTRDIHNSGAVYVANAPPGAQIYKLIKYVNGAYRGIVVWTGADPETANSINQAIINDIRGLLQTFNLAQCYTLTNNAARLTELGRTNPYIATLPILEPEGRTERVLKIIIRDLQGTVSDYTAPSKWSALRSSGLIEHHALIAEISDRAPAQYVSRFTALAMRIRDQYNASWMIEYGKPSPSFEEVQKIADMYRGCLRLYYEYLGKIKRLGVEAVYAQLMAKTYIR